MIISTHGLSMFSDDEVIVAVFNSCPVKVKLLNGSAFILLFLAANFFELLGIFILILPPGIDGHDNFLLYKSLLMLILLLLPHFPMRNRLNTNFVDWLPIVWHNPLLIYNLLTRLLIKTINLLIQLHTRFLC